MSVTINGYVIDASLTETHSYASEVTEYPVETGAEIADNVRPKPIVVTIEGVVSDTPIGAMADVRRTETTASSGDFQFVPSDDALARLKAIRDAREPVTIETTLQSFDSMVLTNLEIPRDAKTGGALRFTATFQQVILVTNLRTTIRVATPSVGGQRNLGNRVGLGQTNLKVGGKKITKTGYEGPDHMPVYVDANGKRVAQKDLDKATKDAGAIAINPRTGQPLNPSDVDTSGPPDPWWDI